VSPDALADDAGRQQPPEPRDQGAREADVAGRPGRVADVLETGGVHREGSQDRRLDVLLDALASHGRDHLCDQQVADVGVRRTRADGTHRCLVPAQDALVLHEVLRCCLGAHPPDRQGVGESGGVRQQVPGGGMSVPDVPLVAGEVFTDGGVEVQAPFGV
jgi:hypothetical protein